MMVLKLLIGLSIIVFVHELGHFLAAKLFKVRVDKFYLFFDIGGVKLLKFKKGKTEFGIGWFPLGGYVKLAGMVDESLDTQYLKQAPQSWEFRAKPAWQKIIIMSAGVIFNLFLGVLIFSTLTLKEHYIPNSELKNGIYAYKAGRELGFQTGDKILKRNGKTVDFFSELSSLSIYKGNFLLDRKGEKINIVVPDSISVVKILSQHYFSSANFLPIVESIIPNSLADKIGLQENDQIVAVDSIQINSYGEFTEVMNNSSNNIILQVKRLDSLIVFPLDIGNIDYLGVIIYNPIKMKKYNVLLSLKKGIKQSIDYIYINALSIGLVFKGEIRRENISGPIGVAKVYGSDVNIFKFFSITAILSLMIGFVNILPIPGLDGGHILVTLIELISRRKFSNRILIILQTVGLIIITIIMLFAIYNDIINLL